jgi:hypothetical protein
VIYFQVRYVILYTVLYTQYKIIRYVCSCAYCVRYTVYGIRYTVYGIRYTIMRYTVYGVRLYGIRYMIAVYNYTGMRYTGIPVYGYAIYTVHGMRYTVYGLRCGDGIPVWVTVCAWGHVCGADHNRPDILWAACSGIRSQRRADEA